MSVETWDEQPSLFALADADIFLAIDDTDGVSKQFTAGILKSFVQAFWEVDVDANSHNLSNLDVLTFANDTGSITGTDYGIVRDGSGLILNVGDSLDSFFLDFVGTTAHTFTNTNYTAPTILADQIELINAGAGINPVLTSNSANQDLELIGNLILNAHDPSLAGSINDVTNFVSGNRVFVVDNYAYMTAFNSMSFSIIDISDPTTPVRISTLTDATNLNGAQGVCVKGNYAYVAARESDTLAIIDISDPTVPVIIGKLTDATNLNGVRGIDVVGRYAYTTSQTSDNLAIIDISDPTNPVLVGIFTDGANMDSPNHLTVKGNYAYIPSISSDSLHVIDISDPTNPTLAGSILDATNLNGAFEVQVSGRYAYVTGLNGNTLTRIDVSDPTTPTFVNKVTDATNLLDPQGLFISGNYAYVVSQDDRQVTVVDISDPTVDPIVVGSHAEITNLSGITGIFVAGNFVYCAANGVFTVLNITGINVPTANIGNADIGYLSVDGNAVIGNNLSIGTSLNVGISGIHSDGNISTAKNATINTNLNIGGAIEYIDNSTQINAPTLGFENDISTLSFVQEFALTGKQPVGLAWSTDRLHYVIAGFDDIVTQFDLTVAGDISTGVAGASFNLQTLVGTGVSLRGIAFSTDGLKLYAVDNIGDRIFQIDLATKFDISSPSFVPTNFIDISGNDTSPTAIFFNGTGTRMFVYGNDNKVLLQFNLSIPDEVTSAVFTVSQDFSSFVDSTLAGIGMTPDGKTLYLAGLSTDTIYQFNLPVPDDITIIELETSTFDYSAFMGDTRNVEFNAEFTKCYFISFADEIISEFNVGLSIADQTVSALGDEEFDIFREESLDSFNVSGVTTLPTGVYTFRQNMTLTRRIEALPGAIVILTSPNGAAVTITYNGADASVFLTASDTVVRLTTQNIRFNLDPTNVTFWNNDAFGIGVIDCQIFFNGSGAKKIGTSDNVGGGVTIRDSLFFGHNDGWDFPNIDNVQADGAFQLTGATTVSGTIMYNFTNITTGVNFRNCGNRLDSTEILFSFDDTIVDPVLINIDFCRSQDGIFYNPAANHLDQTAINVTAIGNDSPDSKNIGSVVVRANATATTTTANVWTDISFSNASIHEGSNIEQWELTDPGAGTNAEQTYIGLKQFNGVINATITIDPSQNNRLYAFRIVVDGSPTGDLIETPTLLAGNTVVTLPFLSPLLINTGQTLRIQIEEIGTSSAPVIPSMVIQAQNH